MTESTEETWANINNALKVGLRGLPGGSSLAKLLAAKRGVRNFKQLPHLTEERIIAWAKTHHAMTSEWPKVLSGPIADDPGETWLGVNTALDKGQRGLPGRSSLAQLLAKKCGAHYSKHVEPITVATILMWADAFHARTGKWPKRNSGAVDAAPGETWAKVDGALQKGRRGFSGGSSLARLIKEHRTNT